MGVTKTIEIDGRDVQFKASADIPRIYRIKFRRDIYTDLNKLVNETEKNTPDDSTMSIESLEIFENIAYIMAKHADPNGVPSDVDSWLEQFNTFSIYQIHVSTTNFFLLLSNNISITPRSNETICPTPNIIWRTSLPTINSFADNIVCSLRYCFATFVDFFTFNVSFTNGSGTTILCSSRIKLDCATGNLKRLL